MKPDSMDNPVAIANVIAVWPAAWERLDAEVMAKAEATAVGVATPATNLEISAMAAAYKLTVLDGERLDPKDKPSRSYVGRKLQELEEGELETESLEEVMSKGDGEEQDSMFETLDSSGKRRNTRKSKKIALPSEVQELQQ